MDLLHGDEGADKLVQLAQRLILNLTGVGDEDMAGTDGFAGKAFCHILLVNGLHIAAIFFVNTELATVHLKSGLEMQQVRAERGDAGAAAAFPHELQRVEDKAGVYLVGEGGDMLRDLTRGHAAITALGRLDHKKTDAR